MYKQSRSKRWLGVLREALTMLKMAEKSVAMYAEAATRMQGVRVVSERDKDVMTGIARDNIKLTLRSQNLGGESHLADALAPIAKAMDDFSLGDQFSTTLRALIDSIEDALPLLEEQMAEHDATIDEITGELERALLISLVVTLTSHNVLIQKVEEWERPHQTHSVGAGLGNLEHRLPISIRPPYPAKGQGQRYPEAQAVAYAQWFSYAFSLWEEQFRGRIATCFDKHTSERIRGSDVRNDYFGDIRLIRNDFVHNKGICKDSAQLKRLEWGLTRRRQIEITPEQMLSLIDLFPRDELSTVPTPLPPGDTVRVPGKVDPHVLEDVQTRAQKLGLNDSQLLEAALSDWLARNGS
ncbi:hypothetical protein [Mycobacteroides chelonae]|uniref:hypothetical protein n=1 Tax=Mycobacteroides chelonae TaxID=1774 RepID=UPI0018B039AE|nr:hypothetical protein [Mycobacteroides chelonae]MBF9315832.1 hypothetical protein [Mycobacteroides chelonae]